MKMPKVLDRATFQAELDVLRVREKAHTREGDAIAAARRRLPMVEVDPTITLIGPHGPVTLLEGVRGASTADRLLLHVAHRPTRHHVITESSWSHYLAHHFAIERSTDRNICIAEGHIRRNLACCREANLQPAGQF